MAIHNLKDMLIYDEGMKLKAYKCPEDYWTIGVGHNLETNSISTKVAFDILRDDIENTRHQMLEHNELLLVMRKLDKIRNSALVNMAFQMGVHGLLSFKKMLAALEQGNWILAYNHALDSKWYKQTPLRARRVANVLHTGTFNAYNPEKDNIISPVD